jgi:hypothetical protein
MSKSVREMTITLKPLIGDFAEDKDAAAQVREETLRPALAAGHRITLDFKGVRVATQSFIHALISDVLRQSGEQALDRMTFKDCSKAVRGIVETVVQYSLESLEGAGASEAASSPKSGKTTNSRRRKPQKA